MRTAAEFVKEVKKQIANGGTAIMYAEGDPATSDPNKIWQEMRGDSWRMEAVQLLKADNINGHFAAPDDLDDWTFHGRMS